MSFYSVSQAIISPKSWWQYEWVIKNLNSALPQKEQIVANESYENDLSVFVISLKYVEKCVLLHIRENTPALAPISILWSTFQGLDRLGLSGCRYVLMVLLTVRPHEYMHEGLTRISLSLSFCHSSRLTYLNIWILCLPTFHPYILCAMK